MLGKGVGRLGGLLTIGRLLQIAAALILIKFLTPTQMGSVAFLTAVFVGVYSLTNLGFDRYLIHAEDEHIDGSTVNNIWTLQLIRGAFVFIFCLVISYVAPLFVDFESEITAQLIVIGIALFVHNLSNPGITLFERKGDYSYIAYCRGLSMIGGAIAILSLVYFLRSPWVYVLAKLITTLLYTLLTFYFSNNRVKLAFDFDIAKKVFSYCKYLLVISIVSVIAVQFENYYIAFAFGAEVLGLYYTWARLVYMPRELLAQLSDRILFVKACSARRDKNNTSLVNEHLLVISIVSAFILPFYSMIWFHGGWFISLMAGDAWVPYHWVGQFFVVIGGLHLIALLFSPLVLANFPKISSGLRSVEVMILVVLMLWLGDIYGIQGVLIASALSILLAMFVRIFIVYRYVLNVAWIKHFSILLTNIMLGLGIFFAGDYFFGVDQVNMQPNLGIFSGYFLYWLIMGGVIWTLYRQEKMRIKPS